MNSYTGIRNISLLTAHFRSALERIHAAVITLGSMEEAEVVYRKSGGGMEDILNTIPLFGTVNAAQMQHRHTSPLHQVWAAGALGVAENGAVWLHDPALIGSVAPFICEHLVIVLEAKNLVADMHEAHARAGIKRFGVFPAGPACAMDIGNSLFIGGHRAQNIIVYLVGKEYKTADGALCGPGCDCW